MTKIPAKFATKADAEQVAVRFPLSSAVFIPAAYAKFAGVPVGGWYVGFPQNVSRRFVSAGEVATA